MLGLNDSIMESFTIVTVCKFVHNFIDKCVKQFSITNQPNLLKTLFRRMRCRHFINKATKGTNAVMPNRL